MFCPSNTKAVFINLDEDVQRHQQIQIELVKVARVVGPAVRLAATRCSPGWQGCRQSHIRVLQNALASEPDAVQHLAIFEDDFMWQQPNPATILRAVPAETEYDVILIAHTLRHADPASLVPVGKHFIRVTKMPWTAGYIVHRRFWSALLACWLANDTCPVDDSWQALQTLHLFLALCPLPAIQRPGMLSSINSGRTNTGDWYVALVCRPPATLDPICERAFPSFVLPSHLCNEMAAITFAARLCETHNCNACVFILPADRSVPPSELWDKFNKIAIPLQRKHRKYTFANGLSCITSRGY